MADKELRRLKRSELVEIIYELQKQNKKNFDTIKELEKELAERRIKISEAGSIAEAAMKLNGIFELAQSVADQYLDSVYALGKDENDSSE